MDPLSPVALGLGAASLTIQVFDGVKKGYRYFEAAVNMPKDCASLRLRLHIEYNRLLDWGDAAGLSDSERHEEFDRNMRANRAIIAALLSEMKLLLRYMSNLSLEYKDLGPEDSVLQARSFKENGTAAGVAVSSGEEHGGGPKIRVTPAPNADIARDHPYFQNLSKAYREEPIRDMNLDEYRRTIFQSPYTSEAKKKPWESFKNTISRTAREVVTVGKHPKRVVWAMKDKEKFQRSLKRLTELTSYLHETLDDNKMQLLLESTHENCMAMLQLTQSVAEMKELLAAARIGRITGPDDEDTTSLRSQATTVFSGRDELEKDDSRSALTRQLHKTLFERLTLFSVRNAEIHSEQATEDFRATKLDEKENFDVQLRERRDKGLRSLAIYNGKHVWVEWKSYTTSCLGMGATGPELGPSDDLLKRIGRLVTLLQVKDKPVEFCIPYCLGYFEDESQHELDRIGLIYEIPTNPQDATGPQSLLQLLHGNPVSIHTRISLAQSLATSLLYLHAVNWLHKGLRSANVLFFSRSGSDDFGRPYVSGFEYARPDKKNMTSTSSAKDPEWVVYCHPDYQSLSHGGGFRKTYDFYSLGIILLEIAYWKTADEILRFGSLDQPPAQQLVRKLEVNGGHPMRFNKKSLSDTRNIRNRLLKEEPQLLDHVGMVMGSRYKDAVRACIGGLEYFKLPADADQTDPQVSALIQQAYLCLVVEVLKGIVV